MKVSIFDLPHILGSIRDFVDPSDHLACAFVCFQWSKVFGPFTWRSFVFKERDYDRLLKIPEMEQRFLARAPTIREATIDGGFFLYPLSPYLGRHRDLSLFQNQLTRLFFNDWKPDVDMGCRNFEEMWGLMNSNKDSLESIELCFRLLLDCFHLRTQVRKGRSSEFFCLYQWPAALIADMGSLTSIILKGPTLRISSNNLFLLFANCPDQVQVLRIEHPVHPFNASVHILASYIAERWNPSSLPVEHDDSCRCKERMDEIWTRVTPTQIRVLALPGIMDSEQERPALLPFLRRRCPKLQSLKIKYLGIPLGLLASSLNRELFPDLRHLELDGIRRHMATNYQNMFPIYKLLLEDVYPALESLTISEDSDLVDDVPRLVVLVLERHASTLKTVRWLGSAGKVGERLDLEWFLKACSNLERVEITGNHGFCTLGQATAGTIVITDVALLDQSNCLPHNPFSEPSSLPLAHSLVRSPSQLGPSTPSMFSTFWTCGSSLTYLDISFRPSPDVKNEHQYRMQIEHFYKKLGQMTALVELHIGCECRCRGIQLRTCRHSDHENQNDDGFLDIAATTGVAVVKLPIDTRLVERDAEETESTILDMSLATGLGHLAGLSKLQVLNISRIHGHRVREPELEWMKAHWTKLRVLQGVKKKHLVDWAKASWPKLDVVLCNCVVTDRKLEWKWHYQRI
ncbi:hypothetical protein BGX33_010669 [Mortierella sp. NVP41]|nr:hypothetical protein BGX33_010669 [Mortierella sp. NVP41]